MKVRGRERGAHAAFVSCRPHILVPRAQLIPNGAIRIRGFSFALGKCECCGVRLCCSQGSTPAPCWFTLAAPRSPVLHSSVLAALLEFVTSRPLYQATIHGFLAAPDAGAWGPSWAHE